MRDENGLMTTTAPSPMLPSPVIELKTAIGRAIERFRDDQFDEFENFWNRIKTSTYEAAKTQPFNYPLPPRPILKATEAMALPNGPGIYFIWGEGVIKYVGKSGRLLQRCTSAGHGRIYPEDWLSWIEMPISDLHLAECFYIGTLRPERNQSCGIAVRST